VLNRGRRAIIRLISGGPKVLSLGSRYLIAGGLTGLAVAVRFAIAPQDAGIPFVTFFPAATLAALIGGFGPGMLATALGAVAAMYFFLAPINSFAVEPSGYLAALVFCLDQLVVCSAIETMRRYYQNSIDSAKALRQASVLAARAQQAAERASEAKSRFLAAASHDLRQPYQAMRLYHATMENRLNDPAAMADLLERMDAALAAGEGLLQSLLDLSTLDAGIVTARPAMVVAADLLGQIGMRHRPVAEAKGLDFRLDAEPGAVWTDPVLLGRLLDNLIVNAIRYTEKGRIRVSFRSSGGRARFLVADSGIGIAPEHREEVFEEFFQVGNSARAGVNGVGLGLAVVRKMAALMKLSIKMRSRLGRGTVFAVGLDQPGAVSSSAG